MSQVLLDMVTLGQRMRSRIQTDLWNIFGNYLNLDESPHQADDQDAQLRYADRRLTAKLVDYSLNSLSHCVPPLPVVCLPSLCGASALP